MYDRLMRKCEVGRRVVFYPPADKREIVAVTPPPGDVILDILQRERADGSIARCKNCGATDTGVFAYKGPLCYAVCGCCVELIDGGEVKEEKRDHAEAI